MISMNQEVGVTFTLFDVGTEAEPDIQTEIQSVQTVQPSRLGAKIKSFLWIEGDECVLQLSIRILCPHIFLPPSAALAPAVRI